MLWIAGYLVFYAATMASPRMSGHALSFFVSNTGRSVRAQEYCFLLPFSRRAQHDTGNLSWYAMARNTNWDQANFP
jgi:hypothetical protein